MTPLDSLALSRETVDRLTEKRSDREWLDAAWADGVLFFGSDDGHVYAVDSASGRQRWKFRTGGPVAASPALAGGRVFVGSYDGRFYALDARTGELLWKFNTGGGVKISVLGPLRARLDYRVFKLRGAPLYSTVHRFYAGVNLGF